MIDQSSTNLDELSGTRKPEFEEKTVFLKMLLEGEKSLLYYYGDGLKRFFIESEGVLTPLVSKAYMIEPGQVRQNDAYKGQLTAYLGVDENIRDRILACDYSKRSLIGVFVLYHQLICDECVTYKKERHYAVFISPVLGVDIARFCPLIDGFHDDVKLNVVNVCIGVELEYVLPFNNAMWSFFSDPTVLISTQNKTKFVTNDTERILATFDYNYLKIPLGFRYRNHLSDDLVLMFDASVYYTLNFNSPVLTLDVENNYRSVTVDFEKRVRPCISLGCGLIYHDFVAKVGINGLNNQLSQVYLHSHEVVAYNSVSLSLAYRFQISE